VPAGTIKTNLRGGNVFDFGVRCGSFVLAPKQVGGGGGEIGAGRVRQPRRVELPLVVAGEGGVWMHDSSL